MSFDQLVSEIKKLPREEQVQLVDHLVENLGSIRDPEMDREHLEIIAKRMQNPGLSIPGEEVLKQARELLDEL